jgi:hypothetical protein
MLFLLFYLNLPLFYLFQISGSKMDLKSILRYFITKEKLAFSLYLLGIASYFPQHILYFLPLPHGTHKSAYFSTLIFLKPFICGLFCIFSFLILPLKSSVCGSKTSFFPHLLSFIAISLYHFLLIISS